MPIPLLHPNITGYIWMEQGDRVKKLDGEDGSRKAPYNPGSSGAQRPEVRAYTALLGVRVCSCCWIERDDDGRLTPP